jgi:hypothetical protein
MADEPLYRLFVIGDEPGGRLVMEPAGGQYELPAGRELRIDVNASGSNADATIEHQPGFLTVWLDTMEYRIWDDGVEITNQAL